MNLRFTSSIPFVCLIAASAAFAANSCTPSEASGASAPSFSIVDAPLEPYRAELLQIAFESVSGMPRVPHLKNRSRAQDRIVAACFELDQPLMGLGYAQEIVGWRRGVGLASYATYCAERGAVSEAEHYLALAQVVVDEAREAGEQAWRSDLILAGMASTRLHLGRNEEAVLAARAAPFEEGELDTEMDDLENSIESGDLDLVRGASQSLAKLYERFYGSPGAREEIEAGVEGTSDRVPLVMWVALQLEFADVALRASDPAHVLEIVGAAEDRVAAGRLSAEVRIPLLARLARARYLAGDVELARRRLEECYSVFDRERHRIVSVFRADVLRPVAEAYHAMQAPERAHKVYRRALEEGADNPNARPRAEDLAETCVSMARVGFAPDAELWARIRELAEGLGDPW